MSIQRVYSRLRSAVVLSVLPLTFATVIPKTAQAASIANLFTTGVDNGGNVLPLGSPDSHYKVIETNTNSFVISDVRGNYMPNNSTSEWIWQNANGSPTNVTRTFRTTFDLTGFDPSTALISGTWAVDNVGVDILINGVGTGHTIPYGSAAFQLFKPFAITSGFTSGLNTLDFIVRDEGVVSAFRVGQISGTADPVSSQSVPEPTSTLSLFALGSLGIGAIAKRKLNKKNQDDNLN